MVTTQYFTKAELEIIPKIYETEEEEEEEEEEEMKDKLIVVKLFTPWSNWTWYVIEYDGEDTCWGFVKGLDAEFGYFSLKELQSLEGPFGLRVEKDKWFEPTQVGNIDRW